MATGAAETPPEINKVAILSLVLGILGCVTFLLAVPAIVVGWMALRQIRLSGQRGRGLAITGVVLGTLVTVLGVLAVLVLLSGGGGAYSG